MSQIYSALAYYWDHKIDMDTKIDRIDQWATNARQQAGETLVSQKLRQR